MKTVASLVANVWKRWVCWWVVAEEPVPPMTDLESFILDTVLDDPSSWLVREAHDGNIRADRVGITIVSKQGTIAGEPLKAVATCGRMEFGERFAGLWHSEVQMILEEANAAVTDSERDRVLAVLKKAFEV